MTRKRESYVQTAFDALAELGVKRGSHVILDDIVERVGWAIDQPDERARLSGGLSALVYHGIVSRTQSRIGHQRVYRVDRKPTPKLRPGHKGRQLGFTYQRAAGSERRSADRPPEPEAPDLDWMRRRLRGLDQEAQEMQRTVRRLLTELDKLG